MAYKLESLSRRGMRRKILGLTLMRAANMANVMAVSDRYETIEISTWGVADLVLDRGARLTGTYVGRSERLIGKTAMLLSGDDTKWIAAQFDDRELPEAFGWWIFLTTEFEITIPSD